MKFNLAHGAVYAALVLAIAACTGAGGLAGIGGSGYVATGTITGFGSVFVNGIEFGTDSADIEIEGVSGTEDDLGIGMIVKVSGSVNEDGVTGTAVTILFDDELQGPVSSLGALDADGDRSFSVLGIPVIAGNETTFAVSDDVSPAPMPAFDISTIAEGDTVEISGFFNGSGELVATRVELEDNSGEVEVKGTISDLDPVLNQFELKVTSTASIMVDITSLTMLEDLPNNMLENGIFVEVEGSYNDSTLVLTASRIEGEEDNEDLEDSGEFSVEGLVSDYNGIADFRLNGILVNATGAEFEPSSLQTMLANGMRIEAEGAIVNNVLIADEIEARSGSVRVQAPVTFIDPDTGNFEITPVNGQNAIAVTVTTATESEDTFVLLDYVEVRGYVNAGGGVTATRVEHEDPNDDVVLRGTFEAGSISSGSIRVLGIDIAFNSSTSFEDENEASINAATFFSSVTMNSSIVEVKDEAPVDGTADEVEIK